MGYSTNIAEKIILDNYSLKSTFANVDKSEID
jgi:hypothetical protein